SRASATGTPPARAGRCLRWTIGWVATACCSGSACGSGRLQAILLPVVLQVGPRLDLLPPIPMVRVPRDGLFESLVEGSARRPSEQSQFAAVEGVPPVVPRPVGDGAHETGGLAEPLEDGPADVDVAPLVAAADVVDLAGGASLEDHVESLAVVAHEEPVAHVQPVAVEGQRLIIESVRDE